MPSDDPKHLSGSRLSAVLGTSLLQTPQSASSMTTNRDSVSAAAAAAAVESQSRRSSARNSALASMGYPIYEPQSQRPYTPDPAELQYDTGLESGEYQSTQQPGQSSSSLSPPPLPSLPPLPVLPTTPAPAHTNPSTTTQISLHTPLTAITVPTTSSPNLASSPTLNGTPTIPCSAPVSNKPSFQSHRTFSTTSSTASTSFGPPPRPSDLSDTHTSADPFSPFYLHPTTRTSLEVDRAGIKTFSPTASKTAIVSINPVPSTTTSASNLNVPLSSSALIPPLPTAAAYGPYPAFSPHHQNTNSRRGTVLKMKRQRAKVRPNGSKKTTTAAGGIAYPLGMEGCTSNVMTTGLHRGPGSGNHSCELLRFETQQRQRLSRWKMLSVRRRLWIKLLGGFLVIGGVVGLVVGLWWRFARLQGGAG